MEKGKEYELVEGLVAGVVAYVASFVGIMGCYPFVPAVYAAARMRQKQNPFLYVGVITGILQNMAFTEEVKYVFIVGACEVCIILYRFLNHRINGIVGAAIGAVTTFVLNISGVFVGRAGLSQWLTAFCEAFMVLGLALLIYYGLELIKRLGTKKKVESEEYEYAVAGVSIGQMEAFSRAFGGLAQTIYHMGEVQEPDKGEYEEAASCVSCQDRKKCWQTMNQEWNERLRKNRQIIAQQLDEMVELLKLWQDKAHCVDGRYKNEKDKLRFLAREQGIKIQEIHFYENEAGHLMLRGVVAGEWSGGVPVKRYREIVEKVLGQAYRLEKESRCVIGAEKQVLTLYEEPDYYAMTGVAWRKKDREKVSGDSFLQDTLEQGLHYSVISDGMGAGEKAKQESMVVTSLCEQFLKAGFSPELVVKMLNSSYELQGEAASYATLDLAVTDLFEGELKLYKIGAAPSFLVRRDKVEVLESRKPPTGVETTEDLEPIVRRLQHGDFLVMVSDGVLEYLKTRNASQKLSELLLEVHTNNAGVNAKRLLEQVLFLTEGYAMDDMTILVTGFWEK